MSFIKSLRESLHVSPDKEQEIVNELEQHLEEEVHALQLQGKGCAVAKQESENSLGNATDVARAFNNIRPPLRHLLRKIHLQYVAMFLGVYGVISLFSSLLLVLYLGFGFYSLNHPSTFVQMFPGACTIGIPFFILFFFSVRKIRAQGLPLSELRKAFFSLSTGIVFYNISTICFVSIFDGRIRDAFAGRFFINYAILMSLSSPNTLIPVLITTTLFLVLLFLLAVLATGFSKNSEGISIRM
jgi:hypothetical protein